MITLQQNILLTYFISYFYNSRLQATATGSGDMEGLRHGCRTPGIFVLFLLFFTQKIKEKEFDRFVMQYDLVGNMLRKEDRQKSLVKDMSFDSYNRVHQVTNATTSEVLGNYTYDDQGFRVQKTAVKELTVNGNPQKCTNHILYPNKYFGMERQYDTGGTEIPDTYNVVNNIYLNGVRIASVIPNGAGVYYMTDQVDSVKVVTDDNGEALSRMEYMPYGELWFQESLSIQSANGSLGDQVKFDFNPKYNSQELDKESNFYFYNARHYDPELARFITPDTVIDGQNSAFGWNRYMYVHGNPIMYKDPTGHGKIEGGGAVHEHIVKDAAATLNLNLSAEQMESLDEGTAWPDVPGKNMRTDYSQLLMKKGTLGYKSHKGHLQFWHGMSLPKNEDGSIRTNKQVRNDIMKQITSWWNKAKATKDKKLQAGYIGAITHMVSDSNFKGHVWRNNKGEVKSFQDYSKQNSSKHSYYDKMFVEGEYTKYKYNPAVIKSIHDTKVILRNFYQNGSLSAVKNI